MKPPWRPADLRVAVVGSGPTAPGTAALVATVLVWGPVDVAVTLAAWHLEANPLALALGPTGWLATKVLVLAATVWVWVAASRLLDSPAAVDAWMMTLATLGAAFVGLNVAVLAGAMA